MTDSGRYDMVILGGGSGGYACALRAAELGMRVALVERDKVGGTCLHRGCIPTKALLHAAEIADHANEAEAFGVRARFEGIDMGGVNAYKDKVVDRLWKGLTSTLLSRKIDIVSGDGLLVSPNAVRVGDAILEGGHVVLASGSEPRSLPGLAIDGRRVITSDDALRLDYVPGSVVILGGNGKSVILQTQGAAKVIAAADGPGGKPGPVLGVHLVGARVGELIAEGQLIYNWEALPSEVAQLIHPHPTQSEAIGEAHLALAGKPLHVHA